MASLDDIRALALAQRDATNKILQLLDQMAPAVPAGTLDPDVVSRPIAWGAKVTKTFVNRIWWSAAKFGIDPDWLMACIAFESGGTFSAKIKNMAGSGATGLIQFMPKTALGLGTTVDELAAMKDEDQIKYVHKYFEDTIKHRGPLRSLPDCYMAILLPSMVGKPSSAVLFSDGIQYRQNSGLDANRDGKVTKEEASAKVMLKLTQGRQPENIGYGR